MGYPMDTRRMRPEERNRLPCGTRRLTASAVRAIRRNRSGMTAKQQAIVYGVHHRTIEKVRRYETWKWVRE